MLHFVPRYVPKPWGGRRMATLLGRDLPSGPIGEAWELLEGESQTADGRLLGELWRSGALGGRAAGDFPFLLKWLDTSDWLSVQVHPDAESCQRMGSGAPKTECWFVAHAEPNARLLVGHHPGLNAQLLRQSAQRGTIQQWLYELQPRVGDMIYIPAGTLHAIGPGLLLLEVQQPSDTTFRVYDWERPGLDGKPRALHLAEACQSVHYERSGPLIPQRALVEGPCFMMQDLREESTISPETLRVLVAGTAGAVLQTNTAHRSLLPGEVVVCEVADGPLSLLSGQCVWLSAP